MCMTSFRTKYYEQTIASVSSTSNAVPIAHPSNGATTRATAPVALVPQVPTTTASTVHLQSNPENNKRLANNLVQHNYHDHAEDPSPLGGHHALRRPVSSTFPLKLYDMLERIDEDGLSHIVSWQIHGRCFIIHSHHLFKEILPRYFGGLTKVPSFQRQLNLWGFSRLTQGLDRGGYYHELFLRGKPFLVHDIVRIKVKGTKIRAKANPDQEPDFWSMPHVGVGNKEQHQLTVSTPATSASIKQAACSQTTLKSASFVASPSLPSTLGLEPFPVVNTADMAASRCWNDLVERLDDTHAAATCLGDDFEPLPIAAPQTPQDLEVHMQHFLLNLNLSDNGNGADSEMNNHDDDDRMFVDQMLKPGKSSS